MNEAMFSGSVPLEEAIEEKPAWVERLKREGTFDEVSKAAPVLWYRVLYFVFGYAVLVFGIYLMINGIINARQISLH